MSFDLYTGHTNCLNIIFVHMIQRIFWQFWWLAKFLNINCKKTKWGKSNNRQLLTISNCLCDIVHLVAIFFLSIALAKTNICTTLFEEEGVQKLENRCVWYSFIRKGQSTNCGLDPIKWCCFINFRNGTLCLQIQYD